MPERKRTQTQTRHMTEMVETLEDAQVELMLLRRTRNLVPPGWSALDKTAPCAPTKTRTTIRLDSDMLGWYRQLGNGYQTRMNAVLRAYMHAIISKHIDTKDDREWLNLG